MTPIRIDPQAAEPLQHLPPADRILSGRPGQEIVNAYDSPDGKFSAGLWSCEPGSWRVAYTEHEACHLLEGEVVLRGDDGSVAHYRPGDSFVVPAGFTGVWETLSFARKLYAIYQP